ncbi:MAG: hypothetical protein GC189_13835 [Alphaproteobacteria bacterium]|nr:hypothetical protein [Alphaproteobacteria bacterium]
MGFLRAITLVIAASFATACGAMAREAVITVDPETRHQTMQGWEATANLLWDRELNPFLPAIFDAAVDQVGINRMRLEVIAGSESTLNFWTPFMQGRLTYEDIRPRRYVVINDNDNPNDINWEGFDFGGLDHQIEKIIIPMRERLAARGQTLFINATYVAFAGQVEARFGSYGVHTDPEEYAELVLATYLHMQEKYGFTPDSWEMILEPDNVDQWPDGGMIGRAMVATARRLREAGYTPRLIAPSTADAGLAERYLNQIARVPGATDDLYEAAFHRYHNGDDRTVFSFARRARALNAPTSMLEWWFGNATHEVLMTDLTIGNAASWQGRALLETVKRQGNAIVPNDEVRYTAQYYRFTPIGAVRIGARSSAERAFPAVAFANPDGTHTLVVNAAQEGDLSIRGLPPGQYRVSWAVEQGSGALPEPITQQGEGAFSVHAPGRGVVTISSYAPIVPAP